MKKLSVILVYTVDLYYDEEEDIEREDRKTLGIFPYNERGEKEAKEFALSLKGDCNFEIADITTSFIVLQG